MKLKKKPEAFNEGKDREREEVDGLIGDQEGMFAREAGENCHRLAGFGTNPSDEDVG